MRLAALTLVAAATSSSPVDPTVVAAILALAGTMCATFFALKGQSRANQVSARADSHDELRDVIREVREQADRADRRAENAERRADDAMAATRACEQREHDLRQEMEQDRRLMSSMQRRLSRLDGEPYDERSAP